MCSLLFAVSVALSELRVESKEHLFKWSFAKKYEFICAPIPISDAGGR